MLKKLKNFFTGNANSPKEVAPFTIIFSSMGDISVQLVQHLSGEDYRWKENVGIKTIECMILGKFLMDHALVTTFRGKIPDIRIDFYLGMLDSIIKSTLNRTFPEIETVDICKDRLGIYSRIIKENPHPVCWQLIAGVCTGIDYYTEKDLPTFTSSSLVLPTLLIYAQDSLKRAIKE